ncbi:MAG TPA: ATP-binding cassette domain-containing protein [Candidatus Dojkabacteria bacterium]|nr:ATP-binding cassette domain-containing protein [Candidatus Dojkabacteria bacterium]
MNPNTLIAFDNVSKTYSGDIKALDNVSFKLIPGEFAFIIGPSGAGKSTVMKLIIREEIPTTGSILFEDNINIPSIPQKMISGYRQKLGIVFQDLKLIPSKTVRENVEFALEITDKPKDEIQDTSKYLLELVNLNNRADLFPEELSGGERQKAAIARALANDPTLFIADEPTGNLDPENSKEILEILKAINASGTTVMVITHDDYLVDLMQTRVLRMEKGKITKDEKGGYYDKMVKKSNANYLKEHQGEKETIQEAVENSMKEYIKDKKLRNKIKEKGIDNIERLLDLTEEDFEKKGFDQKEIDMIGDYLKNYIK